MLRRLGFWGPRQSTLFGGVPRLVNELGDRVDSLVLVLLGVAAAVLTSKLSEVGVQPIGVGNIPICYNNVFNGTPAPE